MILYISNSSLNSSTYKINGKNCFIYIYPSIYLSTCLSILSSNYLIIVLVAVSVTRVTTRRLATTGSTKTYFSSIDVDALTAVIAKKSVSKARKYDSSEKVVEELYPLFFPSSSSSSIEHYIIVSQIRFLNFFFLSSRDNMLTNIATGFGSRQKRMLALPNELESMAKK